MSLTDAERAEFIRLTQDTYDPEIWDEDDLPLLQKAEKDYIEALRRERESSASEPSKAGPTNAPDVSSE